MKAIARRTNNSFTHRIEVRNHQLTVDEPTHHGGDDEGPSPQEMLAASVASCTAVTIEMYAKRKGWDIGPVEVEVEFSLAERGVPVEFDIVMRLSSELSEEQVERLQVIAGKCPVHRALEAEVVFNDRIELTAPAAG